MASLKTALVLAPHPDDGVLARASIHKLTQAGVEVHYAAFSPCTVSVPDDFEQDILYKELNKAAVQLGISESNIHTFDFPVRNFKNIGKLFFTFNPIWFFYQIMMMYTKIIK